jgi:hypothetical protein
MGDRHPESDEIERKSTASLMAGPALQGASYPIIDDPSHHLAVAALVIDGDVSGTSRQRGLTPSARAPSYLQLKQALIRRLARAMRSKNRGQPERVSFYISEVYCAFSNPLVN